MKQISLGQYYPTSSIMHRLDPRTKVIGALLYIVAAFLCTNFVSFMLLLVSAFALILVSRIPVRVVMRSMRALIFVMAFTAILNVFWTVEADAAPLFQWRFIKIYVSGLYRALFILIRIVSMVIGSSLFLTYTTTPIALTDAIERLLSPLKKLHVPVHEFAMMMTIALRFIPTLMDETDKIMSAQKARGADFSTGSLVQRARALVPIMIPLFASALRRAGELATAMECRCYHGGEGRTRLRVLKLHARDAVAMLVMLCFVGAIVAVNILGKRYGWVYTM